MCIYAVLDSVGQRQIGRMHVSKGKALKSAIRAAKRLGRDVKIAHWNSGILLSADKEGCVTDVYGQNCTMQFLTHAALEN